MPRLMFVSLKDTHSCQTNDKKKCRHAILPPIRCIYLYYKTNKQKRSSKAIEINKQMKCTLF